MKVRTRANVNPRAQRTARRSVVARFVKQLYSELNAGVPPPPNKGMRARGQLVYDEEKEAARMLRRAVFDADYWGHQRSSLRLFLNMSTMPQSRIIRALGPPCLSVMGVAATVCGSHSLAEAGTIPTYLEVPTLDLAPLSMITFGFSLLLVLRTNQSYIRYDEGRKMWEVLLNRSRDIVRQALTFFPTGDAAADSSAHRKATFARWTIVFMLTMKCHLRPGEDLRTEAAKLLTEDELQLLMAAEHKVLRALQVMSHIIEASGVNEFQRLQMQANMTALTDQLACERLLRTPIPVSYTRHTARFLMVWLAILPLALWSKLGWATIPAAGLLTLFLLGIEEIGVDIEDPFGLLPLEAISDTAKADITDILNHHAAVTGLVVQNGGATKHCNGTMFNVK